MSYRIGSFNMCNFSLNAAFKRDLERIARIIHKEKFDIIAMQEVLSEGALEYIKKELNKTASDKNWDARWKLSEPRPKDNPYFRDTRHEGYAFLWDTKRFELIPVSKGENPCILKSYHTINGLSGTRLKHDPLYGRFREKRLGVELRLITAHIVYNVPKNGNAGAQENPVTMRQNEFNILADIYNGYARVADNVLNLQQNLRRNAPADPKPPVWYTILLGDYNLTLGTDIPPIVCFDARGRLLDETAVARRVIYTAQEKPTTVGKFSYVNNYDHFSHDKRVVNIVKGYERIDAVHRCCVSSSAQTEEEKFADYRGSVSDHVPIAIEIDFK